MPFTPSHMAAVLPFVRTPLAPAALAIGAMAPDIPYYVPPVPVAPMHAHSAWGVVGADVVMGAAALLVWHLLLARPALAAAPGFVRRRARPDALAPLRERGWLRGSLLLYASLAVGSATHVLWDSFTHAGRWGVRLVPWLAETHGALPGYRWGQYASGVFGAVVLALWLVAWTRRTRKSLDGAADTSPRASTYRALGWLAIVASGSVAGLVTAYGPLTEEGGPDVRRALFVAATRGSATAGVASVVLAMCWHYFQRSTAARHSRSSIA